MAARMNRRACSSARRNSYARSGISCGSAVWTKPPSAENFKTAVAPTVRATTAIEFACEGSVSGFRPEHVWPAEEVIEVVVHYFKQHRLPEWVSWLEWDSKTNTKKMIPPKGSPPAVQALDVGAPAVSS